MLMNQKLNGEELFRLGREAEKKNNIEAMEYYNKALELNYILVFNHLGYIYSSGINVKRDYNKAI